MKKCKIILIAVFAAIVIIGSAFYGMYRHPKYHYEQSGKLKAVPTVCAVETYFGMPVPKDIALNWHEWAERLVSQHYLYEGEYTSHDVSYETSTEKDSTTIVFWGTGTKEDGAVEQIQDTVTLPFRLYGA